MLDNIRVEHDNEARIRTGANLSILLVVAATLPNCQMALAAQES